MPTLNYRQIPEALYYRNNFHGNSMSAQRYEHVDGHTIDPGRLPQPWRMALYGAQVTYVVYSYGTPIAWVTSEGEIVIPPVKYSTTTSRQQNLCTANLIGD